MNPATDEDLSGGIYDNVIKLRKDHTGLPHKTWQRLGGWGTCRGGGGEGQAIVFLALSGTEEECKLEFIEFLLYGRNFTNVIVIQSL